MTWAWPRSTCTYVRTMRVWRNTCDTITMAEQRTAFKGTDNRSPYGLVHMMSSNYTGFLVHLATSLACHAYALTARAHLCRPVPTMYTALITSLCL